MMTVLLVIHLMIAASLVGVVLLQRSEGGALGIGGGGGGGFLTGRGQANLLTRVTAGLAAGFFVTSILLTVLAKHTAPAGSAFDSKTSAPVSSSAPAATTPPASGTPTDAPAASAPAAAPPADAPAPDAPKGGILDKLR